MWHGKRPSAILTTMTVKAYNDAYRIDYAMNKANICFKYFDYS